MGENIGAAARVMANFGLKQMVLIAPRDGWPNVKAADMAGKAIPLLDDAKLVQTAKEAVAPCQLVFATTSRDRAMHLPVINARAAMQKAVAACTQGQQVGIMFGPERTGLENEEVILADYVVQVPVDVGYPSLNLSQAVGILAYEWQMAMQEQQVNGAAHRVGVPPAPKEAQEGLFSHLEALLDQSDFWKVVEKKPVMWRNIRASLARAQFSEQEVRTWRGILKHISGK